MDWVGLVVDRPDLGRDRWCGLLQQSTTGYAHATDPRGGGTGVNRDRYAHPSASTGDGFAQQPHAHADSAQHDSDHYTLANPAHGYLDFNGCSTNRYFYTNGHFYSDRHLSRDHAASDLDLYTQRDGITTQRHADPHPAADSRPGEFTV